MKIWVLTGLLTLGFLQSEAQSFNLADKGCATITTPQEMQELADYIAANPVTKAKTTAGVDSIPLSIHIVSNTNGSGRYRLDHLLKVLCELNTRYAPVGFYFYVKWPINYIKNSSYYSHNYSSGAQMMNQYNVPNSINLYFVNDPNGACGYFAYGPDAIAISNNCSAPNSTTVTHEIGHYFGLPHTFSGWENGNTPSNPELVTRGAGANCSSTGDYFCDTDADYLGYRWSCPYTGTKMDANGDFYRPDSSLYMSYATDACMSRFSPQQIGRMHSRLVNTRAYLLNVNSPSGAATLAAPNVIYPTNLLYSNQTTVRWNKVNGAQAYYVKAGLSAGILIRQDTITTDTTFTLTSSMMNGMNYSVTVIPLSDINVCMNAETKVVFTYTSAATNVNDIFANDNAITLYPNPASGQVTLKLTAPSGSYQLQITNINGQKVFEQNLQSSAPNSPININTQHLPNGMYMVRVSGNNGSWMEKLMIQH